MSREFLDKVAVVTGAAQGIGLGVASALAAAGARVVLADRSPLLGEAAQAIRERDGDCLQVQVDLEHWDGAQRLAQATLAHYGRCDVLVNNVGGTIWAKPYQHYAPDQIEAEIRRSLFPTLWCCRAFLPTMIDAGSGTIVNVSSVATRGVHRIPYSAAKGGINALTASLAMEHAQHGIRVNGVATGGTEAPPRRIARNPEQPTPQEALWYQAVVDQTIASSLMHRYGSIDEQVAAVLFLASDSASYITGTILPVAGGDQG